jgi:hypothetical protein
VKGGAIGSLFHRFFKRIDRRGVSALIIVGPAESVGGTGKIGQTFAGGLGERESDADVASMFEHEVRKIVCGDGVVRLNGECFFVEIFRLLPITTRFQEACQGNINTNVARIGLNGALVSGDCLVHGAFGDLGSREHEEGGDIILIEIDCFRKSFLGFVVLLIF